MSEDPLRVYFACVGNSGRSQMAEAFCRVLGGEQVECASGGTQPAGEILDSVETVMREVGIGVGDQASTPIDTAWVAQADLVVTMGCGADACPAFHEAEVRDWSVRDPEGRDLEEVREIRDEIWDRVKTFLAEGDLITGPEA